VTRAAEDDEARAAGHRQPRAVGAGQRRRGPRRVHSGRQAARELAQVPRAGDEHGEAPAPEFLVEVRDLIVGDGRRQAIAEQPQVEIERAAELGRFERGARVVVGQHRRAGLQAEDHGLRPLVRRQQDREVAGAFRAPDRLHGAPPLGPGRRHLAIARARQQVAAVEQHARVDVPGHAVNHVRDHVRVPDALEEVLGARLGRARDPRVQRLERVQRDELRNPRVAELRDVGRGAADVAREQLLVRRRPRDLLNFDLDAGVRALEVLDELRDDLALAAHRPEAQVHGLLPRAAAGAARGGERNAERGAECEIAARASTERLPRASRAHPVAPRFARAHRGAPLASSQPPWNPARRRPRTM
jgi:hypothetical protein